MEPPRVAFIGCGRHAAKMLYPCLRLAHMNLAAASDTDEARARRNAKWFGADRIYTNHRRMLDGESLEAVLRRGPDDMIQQIWQGGDYLCHSGRVNAQEEKHR